MIPSTLQDDQLSELIYKNLQPAVPRGQHAGEKVASCAVGFEYLVSLVKWFRVLVSPSGAEDLFNTWPRTGGFLWALVTTSRVNVFRFCNAFRIRRRLLNSGPSSAPSACLIEENCSGPHFADLWPWCAGLKRGVACFFFGGLTNGEVVVTVLAGRFSRLGANW